VAKKEAICGQKKGKKLLWPKKVYTLWPKKVNLWPKKSTFRLIAEGSPLFAAGKKAQQPNSQSSVSPPLPLTLRALALTEVWFKT
jgi:hypothetical protein